MITAAIKPLPKFQQLSKVAIPDVSERLLTGVPGLDACLSESDEAPPGIPLASSILIAGMPGGGKSTIATVAADAAGSVAATAMTLGGCLIISGEEREHRVRARWDRLKLGKKGADPAIARLHDAEEIVALILHLQPRLTVIDSVQTLMLGGSRKYDAQYEAVQLIEGVTVSMGGGVVFVSHVAKNGRDHAGAQGIPHLVDVHLHVSMNAKKAERALEVRKNRHGRAGFQVPMHISISSISCGTPAPITGDGSMTNARTALERAAEVAYTQLMEGKSIDGYDFELAGCSGGMWRAGMDMAVKRLGRDGFEVEEFKEKGRRRYRLLNPPPPPDPVVEEIAESERPLDMT